MKGEIDDEGQLDGPAFGIPGRHARRGGAGRPGALVEGRRTGRLDSTTVRILERDLATIDTAIAQARRALAADPGSAYLNHHLADTMRRKLELLRQATALTGTQS